MRNLIVAAALLAAALPAAANAATFRVPAYGDTVIDVNVCSPRVALSAVGDGDTDLDYVLEDPDGNVVETETSDADQMYLTFRTRIFRSDNMCRTFKLHVRNYGDVYNELSVHVHDA